jgi:uncharacterized membrane protein
MVQDTDNPTPILTSFKAPIGFSIAQIVLSSLGTIDAGLSYLEATKRLDLPCTSDGACEAVAASVYGHIDLFGHDLPVALLGIIGYVTILTLSMAKAASESRKPVDLISWALVAICGVGFAYSAYLQYAALHILNKHCPYCIVSAILMTTLFVVSIFERRSLSVSKPGVEA